MKQIIGFWMFALALTIMLVSFEGYGFGEKIKMILSIMFFLTMIFASGWLLAGMVV